MATKTRSKAGPKDPEPEPTHDEQGGDQPIPNDKDAAWIVAEAQRIFEHDGVYTGSNGLPLSLYGRLSKIIESLPEVKPEGENQHFKYKFVTDKQVLGLLRPRLATQRIIVIPETVVENEPIQMETARGGRSLMARLHVTFRVIDGIAGESFTGEAVGYGDDSGDKGANKAYTAALKNFFIKLFLMGGADRDIEDDPETDRRAKVRESGTAPVQSVQVKETVVEGVQRGGRSSKATEAQVASVSRLVASLGLTPQRLAGAIEIVLNVPDLQFKGWAEVRTYLADLSGEDIGKIIESLSEDEEAAQQQALDAGGGYGS
jgi:hypothetical protein